MENNVVSLEIAKQLKEAGFSQSTLFYWIRLKGRKEFRLVQGPVGVYDGKLCWNAPPGQGMPFLDEFNAAPLAKEVLGELPNWIKIDGKDYGLLMTKGSVGYCLKKNNWNMDIRANGTGNIIKYGSNLAEPLALIYLYLSQCNLLKKPSDD